jgi:anti-anti-sigma factor
MQVTLNELSGGVICAQMVGRLDAAGADAIGLKLTAGIVAEGKPAILDLSGVSFVASMGLRLLISCAKGLKLKGGTLVLFGAQPDVQEVLEQAAIDQLMPVVATQEEALAAAA